jgi:3-oxoacyl-[acyl-carrier-protein] synthase III
MAPSAFGRFIPLSEVDAPSLLTRMSSRELPVDGERYGVCTRLIARHGVQVADLAAAVLGKLFDVLAFCPSHLGGLKLSSRVSDPDAAARQVVERLGIPCPPTGIERACSGFPAAVCLAVQRSEESGKPVAVVAAEIISRNINWEVAAGDLGDHRRARGQAARLFADGAAAVVVGPLGADFPHEIIDAWQSDVADDRQLIQKVEEAENVLRHSTKRCLHKSLRRDGNG